MDKNFINIDDLVRQRLGGGEEPERAGAWMQMRDLLDKEMPQDRAGIIFWRRFFSAITVLVLISTMTIGGYMYSASRENSQASNDANNAATKNTANTNSTPNNYAETNKSADNSTKKKNNDINTDKTTNFTQINSSKQISATYAANRTSVTNSTSVSGNTQSSASLSNAINNSTANSTAVSARVKNKPAIAANTKSVSSTTAANKYTRYASKNSTHKAINGRKFLSQVISANQIAKQKAANKLAAATSTVADKAGNDANPSFSSEYANKTHNVKSNNSSVANATPLTSKQHRSNTGKATQKTQVYAAANGINGKTSGKSVMTVTKKKRSGYPAVPQQNGTVSADKIALSGSLVSTTNTATTAVNNTKTINNSKKSITKNQLATSKNKNLNLNGNTSTTISNNVISGMTNANALASQEVAPTARVNTMIPRIVMSEHYVKTSVNDGYYKLDTISIESILKLSSTNDPTHAPSNNAKNTNAPTSINTAGNGTTPANTTGIAGTSNGANTNTSSNANSSSNAGANMNTPIVPGSSSDAAAKSGMAETKDKQASKSSGASTAEKLTETFNDIKIHVATAHFAAGLTAGINGTFFGPASFKGFQFGVTGNIMFGDDFSILTELKYFERINNNYSLNDDYYIYKAAAGGQYTKQLQPNSYAFSTLHSVELPVSIHYCKNHFNFFVGGNIVYSFSINTGASTPQVNNNPQVLVSSIGTDNAAKIRPNDFDSKLGLGYLFGLSYQLSPTVNLDFRSVQTVWNNSSTQGAKIISNQLYKSPSLQVSIGYRFGGKGKNSGQ